MAATALGRAVLLCDLCSKPPAPPCEHTGRQSRSGMRGKPEVGRWAGNGGEVRRFGDGVLRSVLGGFKKLKSSVFTFKVTKPSQQEKHHMARFQFAQPTRSEPRL